MGATSEHAENKKYSHDFRSYLASAFNHILKLEGTSRKEGEKVLLKLLRLPENSKQAWGALTIFEGLFKGESLKEDPLLTQGSASAAVGPLLGEEDEGRTVRSLSTLSRQMDLLHPLWRFIPSPQDLANKELKVSSWMLFDPRVEIFNSCFRTFEETFPQATFEKSVEKILTLFDKLHDPLYFIDESSSEKGSRSQLKNFIAYKSDRSPPNRFAHRLIRIGDILQRDFNEGRVKRDLSTLKALKEMLNHWALRGEGDCRTGSEEELNRYYLECLLNKKGEETSALTKEDWTLEMQVAVSLAQLRRKLVDELVTEKDNDRIHAVKHLEKKVRVPLGLLGDTEHYVDPLEATISPLYRKMTSQDIIAAVLKRYTPEMMIQHLITEIDHPKKEVNTGKAIDYEKLRRRLRFQYIRRKVTSKGELDHSFFSDEDYVLDRATREEFEHKVLPFIHTSQAQSSLDWDALKGQAYEDAREKLGTEFYDDDYQFTPKGAKSLLHGIGYLEEIK